MELKKLLNELLQKKSISPNDAGCMDIISEILKRAGFNVQIIEFNDVKNLWATYGNKAPLTVLAGHTDVVPAGDLDNWNSDPFEPIEKDGYLYARGAADMKTGVATMCLAAVDFVKNNPNFKGSLGIMLTSDEEAKAEDGIRKLMPYLVKKGVKIDYAVFTEPSSEVFLGDTIKNGRRGSLHAHLVVKGKLGHVAYPEKAANPTHILGNVINSLTQETWCNGNNDFPKTSMQIWEITAGEGANNVIPEVVKMNFNFRFSSELKSEQIEKRVVEIINKQIEISNKNITNNYKFSFDIKFQLSGESFLTQKGKLVDAMVTACEKTLNTTPKLSTSGGTSDARFLAPFGVSVVEFGPVNKTIHQANECIKIEDIEKLKLTLDYLLKEIYL